MKFIINSKVLLSRLLAAGKAVSNRPTLTILGCFHLTIGQNKITIVATDTENTVVFNVEAETEGAGNVCIDAKRLIELFKAMPDCTVTFDMDDATKNITLRYTNGRYNLSGVDCDGFPMPKYDATQVKGSFSMPTTQIIRALDNVDFAVGEDDFRPMLNGVYWEIKPDAITFVATDTRVLVKYRSTQTASGIDLSFNLPEKSLPLVRSFCTKEVNVRVNIYDKMAVFEGSDFKVSTVLLKGNFPPYQRVIPVNPPIAITVDRANFTNAITRVGLCADSTTPLLRMKIANGIIDMVAQDINFNVGGEERIECDYRDSEIVIGFSPIYLKRVLNTINTQNVEIKLTDPTRAVLFLPSENDEYGELTIICMPMSVKA